MKEEKTYYKYLDIIRFISCFGVLLYHLNILKGGYLAVCSFFTLSGYLSCISAFKKEKFSLITYYKNRFFRIYIPLIFVVFITVPVTLLLKDMTWLNLKPEVTSILLGYNNFWQLSANLDYFARHINSPFMHLWYVSILLQFEIIFPILFLLLKKLGEKFSKAIPCMLTLVLTIVSAIYFYILCIRGNIMAAYYNTIARSFALFLGLALGFFHTYYNIKIPKVFKEEKKKKLIFFLYLILIVILFCTIDANSKFFPISMILTSLIPCRLISYGKLIENKSSAKMDTLIKSLSTRSYEIYLLQYPIIFLLQYFNTNPYLTAVITILFVIILSYYLHFILQKQEKFKIVRCVLLIITSCTVLFGIYKFCTAKDYSKEMKELENQLAENETVMKQKQEEYEQKLKQKEEEVSKLLNELKQNEDNLDSVLAELPVVGVGDSVMLGAVENLYSQFPNGYFDAKISRTAWVLNGILVDLKNNNMLGSPIIINVGANGDCPDEIKKEIMNTCEGHEVYWITVTNDKDVHVNDNLLSFASNYENLHIIDWNSISSGHPEYFVADGIHLTPKGRVAYVNAIYENIKKGYLEEYQRQKEEIQNKQEEEKKNTISFYGNDLLINAYDNLKTTFEKARYKTNKDYNFKSIKADLEKDIKENNITNQIVLAFDDSSTMTKEELDEIIKLCENQKLYIVSTSKKMNELLSETNNENIIVLDFYKEMKNHSEYLMPDKIHLTESGNNALSNILKNNLSKTKNTVS